MKLVIATHNSKKAGEMKTILARRFPTFAIVDLTNYPNAAEPEETGTTYSENAAIKVIAAAEATGEMCIADDAGLEVDALGGEPGLFSKRFAGEDTPFGAKMGLILERMRDVAEPERTARFRCAVAVAWPEGGSIQHACFEATCEGRIAHSPSGVGGFGYDPIFYLPEMGCTMADLTADQKHAISHRGKVLQAVGDWLESRYDELVSGLN